MEIFYISFATYIFFAGIFSYGVELNELQFVLSFVDACDKIKINMHLHSFTYDFHLRCIHSYIAGTGPWSLQQGYHLTHFLDDFIKYYSKAPNYARNLIYSGKRISRRGDDGSGRYFDLAFRESATKITRLLLFQT